MGKGMRIGIMLRAYDRPGGIGIYCRNIVKHLLALDQKNEYVLMYNNQEHVGTYNNLPNVEEVFLPSKNLFFWDQWQVPQVVKNKEIDLLFNTKFSLPFLGKATKMMVLHGASWYEKPELYPRLDILYVRMAMPVYCRLADFLISNSDLTTRDFKNFLSVPEGKIETVRLSYDESFAPVEDRKTLDEIRKKYSLPDRFVITVTSYDPRKNFETLLRAFEKCRESEEVHLVVVGKNCRQYLNDYKLEGSELANFIHFPGWVEQQDLPPLYSLAEVFAFPSVYEEFGIPVVEAMACGCPVVSSSTGAIPELTNGAALLADPFDVEAQAKNLLTVLQSSERRENYRNKGLERAKEFSWDKAARATLDIFARFES